MRFHATSLAGVVRIELERHTDERGFFARSWCADEMRAAGLDACVEQTNVSFNARAGTLRGLHWQDEPHGECKVVRCTRGAVLDAAVDLRPDSPTRLEHVTLRLDADNRSALYIPRGVAHGFLTLEADTEVAYLMSTRYAPDAARGLRHDDPALGIDWTAPVAVISSRDASWPLLEDVRP